MLHNNLIVLLRDHRSRLIVFGINIVVEVGDDHGELLFCLLVEVGNGNTGSQDGVVRVCDGHVGGSLGSLELQLAGCLKKRRWPNVPSYPARWCRHPGKHQR